MGRVPTFARRHGFDVLIVIGAIEGALEAALRQDAALEPGTAAWIVAPAVAFVVLPLLARRRFPFGAPAAVWVRGGRALIRRRQRRDVPRSVFAAGMAAAFLLGNVADAPQAADRAGGDPRLPR